MLKLYFKACELAGKLRKDESGASLAEYALLIALVLVGAAVAITALTTNIGLAIDAGTAELVVP